MFDLSLSDDGHLARLTLRAPERLNALRRDDWRALADLLNQHVSPLPGLRALLIAGEGPRAFCAGGDIKEFSDIRLGADAAQAYNQDVDQALRALAAVPVPTLARIHASCFGGGLMLALACDLRYAAADAGFCAPPAKMGFTYNMVALERLEALVGPGACRDLLFTARTIDAAEALSIGLVNDVSPDAAALDALLDARLAQILALAPLSHRAHKRLLDERPAPGSLAERHLTDHLYDSEDYRQAVDAFIHRSKPEFKGQ